jgi:two-component system sensor histidine kinase ResE
MVSNAKDAMPEGGTFTISTAKAGDRWELGLRDTGSGIPADQRSKIFELFATFGKINGTGLGLAMVSDIVEGHGGTISVESRTAGEDGSQESGTLFLISLPVQPAAATEDHS